MTDDGPLPRLLVLMGSGETSPTMVRTHRDVLSRLGPPPVPAVLLDTPFGFQCNADDIVRRAVRYFRDSVNAPIGVVSYRRATEGSALAHEAALARLRDARYVFSGPGSPTYALRQWSSSSVPALLREKLRSGGCVAFASAAALTLGRVTVPVYEIYKAGADPVWLPGLDLLAEAGLSAAVIPHFDNAEGGTHDTRFCYLGEERLAAMERELPAGTFVLGIDEHTACVLDLDAGTATVAGLSAVTVRSGGTSHRLPARTRLAISDISDLAAAGLRSPLAAKRSTASPHGDATVARATSTPPPPPLLADVATREAEMLAAAAAGDLDAAVSAVLSLESALVGWAADTLESDALDLARATLRSMIARLAEVATVRSEARAAELSAPLVDTLLDLRSAVRAAGRWDEADAIRRRLEMAGIEVRDEAAGTSWSRRI